MRSGARSCAVGLSNTVAGCMSLMLEVIDVLQPKIGQQVVCMLHSQKGESDHG